MKNQQDYIKDIAEIRSMMERSSKFLSLSGLAGVTAGLYAITGAWIAFRFFGFNPDQIQYMIPSSDLTKLSLLALLILVLAVGTAILLSRNKADKTDEKVWNITSRRMLMNMIVPLSAGAFLILILVIEGYTGLVAPLTLIFYGVALFNASAFTYDDVKFLGIIQIVLGLLSSVFIEYGLIIWTVGFGLIHIIYGFYMHIRYER